MRGIPRKEVLLYKSILILEKNFNTNLKYTTIPGIIYGFWAVEILVFYGAIKSVPQFLSNTALASLFIMGLFNVGIACFWGNTRASKAFTESQKLLNDWRRNARDKIRKKEIKSLYPARFRVGDCYIDQSTPLVAQNFIANQTISLILL